MTMGFDFDHLGTRPGEDSSDPGRSEALRLLAKVNLADAASIGVDLGLLLGVTAPTGAPAGDFLGDGTASVHPELVVSRRLGAVHGCHE